MQWMVKLEARSGWGEVKTIEVGRIQRRVDGLTAEEVGLTPAEGKDLLGERAANADGGIHHMRRVCPAV